MLKLKCLATGSSGNCYLLSTENETLILDCGIPIKEIKKGLDFDFSKVVGCVTTHAHSDHNRSVIDIAKLGIPIWQPFVIGDEISRWYFGGFAIRSFSVPHDNEPCCGLLIECPNGEKLVYATDFEYIKYSFKKMRIQHLLIECNYQNKYVEKSASNREHFLRGHAELNTTLGVVKDNADSLRNVILCHLSKNNINPIEAKTEIEKNVNCSVYIAEKGLEVELFKIPF